MKRALLPELAGGRRKTFPVRSLAADAERLRRDAGSVADVEHLRAEPPDGRRLADRPLLGLLLSHLLRPAAAAQNTYRTALV